MSGITCKHAVAAIWNMATNGIETAIPESYCHPCHWLSTWEEMYRSKINPTRSPDFWDKCNVANTIIPPDHKPQIGRPRKKRRKTAAELADIMVQGSKLSRSGKSVTCKLCKQVVHNQRRCKGQSAGGSKKTGVGSKKGSGGSKKASGGSKKAGMGSKKAGMGSKKAGMGSQTGMGSESQQNLVISQAQHATQTSVVSTNASPTRKRPLPLVLQASPSRWSKTSANRYNSP